MRGTVELSPAEASDHLYEPSRRNIEELIPSIRIGLAWWDTLVDWWRAR